MTWVENHALTACVFFTFHENIKIEDCAISDFCTKTYQSRHRVRMKYLHYLKTNERGFAEAFLKNQDIFSKSREVGEFPVECV